jgi:hypothetical protein
MRMGVHFALLVLGVIALVGLNTGRADAWPVRYDTNIRTQHASIQPVGDIFGDTCWWWGTRWQYGWRGYGWYACFEQPRPAAPVAIAPESVPQDAIVMPDPCLRTWRDKSGKVRSRRIC